MEFQLQELSKMQAVLDQTILDKHNLSSKDTVNERILAFMVELAELANETRCFKYWSLQEASERDVVLEEYVDGIHFLTSLGNELVLENSFVANRVNVSLTEQFSDIFAKAGNLKNNFNKECLANLYVKYLELGILLNFTSEDIILAYYKKNQENHKRQEQGY